MKIKKKEVGNGPFLRKYWERDREANWDKIFKAFSIFIATAAAAVVARLGTLL